MNLRSGETLGSIESAEVVQPYFDLFSGQLLIGEAALDVHIESGGNPADIILLRDLLLGDEHVVSPGSYDRTDADNWRTRSNQDYLAHGRWLSLILSSPGKTKTALSQTVIERCNYIGLGPSMTQIAATKRFGSLTEFYNQLDEISYHETGLYDHWSINDFADYVEEVLLELLEKRSAEKGTKAVNVNAEIERRGSSGEGPTRWKIFDRGGGVARLLALKGYVDVKRMTENDYVDWGVRFMFANNGRAPDTPTLDTLAKVRRAPSSKATYTKFGSIPEYQSQVEEKHQSEVARIEAERGLKLADIRERSRDGSLPVELLNYSQSDSELICAVAKYKIIKNLVPKLQDLHEILFFVFQNTKKFVQSITELSPALPIYKIEEEASTLGVFYDIWPFDDYLVTLKVA